MSGKKNNYAGSPPPKKSKSGKKQSGKYGRSGSSGNDRDPSTSRERSRSGSRRYGSKPNNETGSGSYKRNLKSKGDTNKRSKRKSGSFERPVNEKTVHWRHRKSIEAEPKSNVGLMRLNKYVAHSGICSRREADELIADGKVKVNGTVVRELGTKVKVSDKIEVEDRSIEPEPYVYLLMNKPHNTITTTSDEKGRRTVMDLVENVTGKRVYPVGRLDRNTTGILLLTNDGELANRLMHPSYRIGKIYEVTADRTFTDEELGKLKAGVTLDDGEASAYFIQKDPAISNVFLIGVQEGRNHLVRRMIEALGGEVIKLKRVKYAGLTLKGLRPGRWRSLFPDEINRLREMVKLQPLKIIRKNG